MKPDVCPPDVLNIDAWAIEGNIGKVSSHQAKLSRKIIVRSFHDYRKIIYAHWHVSMYRYLQQTLKIANMPMSSKITSCSHNNGHLNAVSRSSILYNILLHSITIPTETEANYSFELHPLRYQANWKLKWRCTCTCMHTTSTVHVHVQVAGTQTWLSQWLTNFLLLNEESMEHPWVCILGRGYPCGKVIPDQFLTHDYMYIDVHVCVCVCVSSIQVYLGCKIGICMDVSRCHNIFQLPFADK